MLNCRKIFCIVFPLLVLYLIIKLFESKIEKFEVINHNYGDYKVVEIPNLLTSQECDDLIKYSLNQKMEISQVVNNDINEISKVNTDYRKSKTLWIKDSENAIAKKVSQLSQQITGLPIENQEQLQIVSYDLGGNFVEHYDSCVTSKELCNKINNGNSDRRSTLLIYLNDDYTGGETEFVKLNLKIKPEKGKAILFWSTDENEKLLEKSMHKGNIVLHGNKWIATKWSHNGPYK